MSSEGLLKNGKKKVVIVGAGAAGMVSYPECSWLLQLMFLVLRRHPCRAP